MALFLNNFSKAKVENDQIVEQAEREATRLKANKARGDKGQGGAGGNGGTPGEEKKDLFSAFKAAQGGTSADIVGEMQMRLAKRRAAGGGGGGLVGLP